MRPKRYLSSLEGREDPMLTSSHLPIKKIKAAIIEDIVSHEKDIGKGAFGSVYRGRLVSDGRKVAVKELSLKDMDDLQLNNIRAEIKAMYAAMQNNCNAFINEIYDVIYDQMTNRIYIIIEYLGRDTLKQYMQTHQMKKESDLLPIIEPLRQGLICLHNSKIAHRDIKPDNVMMNSGVPKWIDLGLSCFEICDSSVIVGNLSTIAPEILLDQRQRSFSEWVAADVWSFGCMIYRIVMEHDLPFQADMADIYRATNSDDESLRMHIEKEMSRKASVVDLAETFYEFRFKKTYLLLRACLVVDPVVRLERWNKLPKTIELPLKASFESL